MSRFLGLQNKKKHNMVNFRWINLQQFMTYAAPVPKKTTIYDLCLTQTLQKRSTIILKIISFKCFVHVTFPSKYMSPTLASETRWAAAHWEHRKRAPRSVLHKALTITGVTTLKTPEQ